VYPLSPKNFLYRPLFDKYVGNSIKSSSSSRSSDVLVPVVERAFTRRVARGAARVVTNLKNDFNASIVVLSLHDRLPCPPTASLSPGLWECPCIGSGISFFTHNQMPRHLILLKPITLARAFLHTMNLVEPGNK